MQKNIFLTVILMTPLFSGCSMFFTPDTLADSLHSQLVKREFESIYDNSCDSLKLKVSKDDFINRAGYLMDVVKGVDQDFNWRTDKSTQEMEKTVDGPDKSKFFSAKLLGDLEHDISFEMDWQKQTFRSPCLASFSALWSENLKERGDIMAGTPK